GGGAGGGGGGGSPGAPPARVTRPRGGGPKGKGPPPRGGPPPPPPPLGQVAQGGIRQSSIRLAGADGGREEQYYTASMRALVAALVAALLVISPAHAAERVIVAFGDSLTAGLGVPPEESYPARLQARLRAEGYAYRVVNAGSSGDTTAGGLRRVDWALKNKPDIVIVALGANDALRAQNLASVRQNLDAIVARFQKA